MNSSRIMNRNLNRFHKKHEEKVHFISCRSPMLCRFMKQYLEVFLASPERFIYGAQVEQGQTQNVIPRFILSQIHFSFQHLHDKSRAIII